MNLTPSDYECDAHKKSLTLLVEEQLETVVVAAFAPRQGRAFRVIVTCPGDGTAGTSHDVACSGTVGP